MADTVIKVDTTKLRNFGQTLIDKAGLLPDKITVVGTASGSITNGWKDANTPTFTSKFNSFVEGTSKLPAEISSFGTYLTSLATEYEAIQADTLAMMGKAS